MRSEVVDVTGIVKYIGKTGFRHTFPLYSVAYVLERGERVLNCSHFRFQGRFRKVLARCSEKGRKSDLSRKIKKSTKFHLRSKHFFFFRFYFAVVEINAALVLLLITSLL